MIHDVVVRPLPFSEGADQPGLVVYRYADHLLHRLGLIESFELSAGGSLGPHVRPRADEVWALLAGNCSFHWRDQRQGSPTQGQRYEYSADMPTAVLVPFGVAFGLRTLSGARLLRLATLDEAEYGGGETVPWAEM